MTAGQIANTFEHAWPTTTRHLQVLEAAGLLQHERQGRSRCYRIDCRRLELVRDWLAWFSKPLTETSGGGHGRTEEGENSNEKGRGRARTGRRAKPVPHERRGRGPR